MLSRMYRKGKGRSQKELFRSDGVGFRSRSRNGYNDLDREMEESSRRDDPENSVELEERVRRYYHERSSRDRREDERDWEGRSLRDTNGRTFKEYYF